MRIAPLESGGLRLTLEIEEAAMLDQLVTQLTQLLQGHSKTALDPDPLFASLEVGGTEELPEDPALARLFPDAYEEAGDSSAYRRLTEQGLVNRKLQDAIRVTTDLGLGVGVPDDANDIAVDITPESLPSWARTLTALRLAMAARIGLESLDDHERLLDQESTRGTVLVFDWLAAILDSVLAVMG